MERSTLIRIINEEIQKVLNEFQEEELNEMATFYKVKGDPETAKKAISQAKEKYREGSALYNTLDTLEKKGEIDYKELSKETGKDIATYNNPKSRGVLEKDLADYIEFESGKKGRKADPNKPKKASTGKRGRPSTGKPTIKKKKSASTSRLEKKYYVDPEDGGPSSKELRDLAKSDKVVSSQLSQLQNQEAAKMIKAALRDLEKQGIVDSSNKILDREAYDKVWPGMKKDIMAKAKKIR